MRTDILLAAGLLVSLAAFGAYNYLFSIYETAVVAPVTELPAGEARRVTVSTIPLNSLGFRAPFRKSPTVFTVVNGAELVATFTADEQNGVLTLATTGEPGTITIRVKPALALFATEVTIRVTADTA